MSEDERGILLVEDDPALALGLSDSLRFEGYRVVHTAKGEKAIELAASEDIGCVILDLMLPDLNGYQVCETIRTMDPILPILMLTARGQEADKIRGLEAGADDYVTKPFSIGELVARIRALFRRAGRSVRPSQAEIRIGDINIETGSQTLTHGSETMHLSFYEVELLKFPLGASRRTGVTRRDPRKDLGPRSRPEQPNGRQTSSSSYDARSNPSPIGQYTS